MRKAQGSSLSLGALFFDHGHAPDRGYGYVGASRFRSAGGLFHYGRLRRSDWRPVGGDPSIEISAREGDSANTDEGDLEAMERDAEYDSDFSGFGQSDCGSMGESCSDSEGVSAVSCDEDLGEPPVFDLGGGGHGDFAGLL